VAEAGALLAAIGAVVAAGCGLVLVVRNYRSRAVRAAHDEADAAELEVEHLRAERVADRAELQRLREQLVAAGVLEA